MSATWYIVAGGPSLKGYNFNRLRNKNVIAVNRAFEKLPNAQYVYFSDKRFFEWFEKPLLQHKGVKVTVDKVDHPEIAKYRNAGRKGLELTSEALKTGNDSTYAALNLAYHLGAKTVVILGLDMSFDKEGATHWHNGYVTSNSIGHLNKMLPFYQYIAEPLKAAGVRVINANLHSKVNVFEKIALEVAHEV